MGGANRDPSRWENPDEYDLFREQKQHMSFAFGPHMCLGMHLARMETTVAINAVLDRLPNVRLDPDAEDVLHQRPRVPRPEPLAGSLRHLAFLVDSAGAA